MQVIGRLNNLRAAQAISDYLRSSGIANQLQAEGSKRWLLLVEQVEQVEQASQLLKEFLAAPNHPKYLQASWHSPSTKPVSQITPKGKGIVAEILANTGWITRTVSLISLLVYLLMLWQPQSTLDALRFFASPYQWQQAQYWRLISPIFMHFSPMHIIFNLMWWWFLAGRIESQQSSARLMVVLLVTALVPNISQFLVSGANFGGLSGVVYGLLGYIGIYTWLHPDSRLRLPPALYVFMLIWLVLGFSGVLTPFVGHIANTAHLAGLISGAAVGLGFALWARNKRQA
jgi:GlpG protein